MMTYLLHLNETIFHTLNRFVGHSWTFDTVIAILESNLLIKGALIGACFLSAWFAGRNHKDLIRYRSMLMATLMATVVSLIISKGLSHSIFFPRPYVVSQHLYHLKDGKLVEFEHVPYNVPLDDASQKLYSRFLEGRITVNSLGAIPSDHAAFYLTISLGILLVARRIGIIAVIWTLTTILTTKVMSGRHFPLDVAIGILIAIFSVSLVLPISLRYLSRFFSASAEWTLNHNKLATAIIFVIAFEIASTLKHFHPLIDFASLLAKNLLHI